MTTEKMDSTSTPTLSLTHLISSYGILPTLASWMSTVDLYRLALTNKTHYACILASPNLFKSLRRQCLCDGRGLARRQAFVKPYLSKRTAGLSPNPDMSDDEEIEVRLYNVKCDAGGALPCQKCDINTCEECRYYPRAAPANWYPVRRPHLTSSFELYNIMCLCSACDAATEKEVAGKFLNERCDCDIFTRWICTRCMEAESKLVRDYFMNHTKLDTGSGWDDGEPTTKSMVDHQFERMVSFSSHKGELKLIN